MTFGEWTKLHPDHEHKTRDPNAPGYLIEEQFFGQFWMAKFQWETQARRITTPECDVVEESIL
jgi:hypothetical protein